MSDGYEILTLDEAETAPHRENTTLIPVRHLLGFRPAGGRDGYLVMAMEL